MVKSSQDSTADTYQPRVHAAYTPIDGYPGIIAKINAVDAQKVNFGFCDIERELLP